MLRSKYSDDAFSHLGNAPVPHAPGVVTIKKFTCELLSQTETGKWCQIRKVQAEIHVCTKQKSLEQN